MKKARTSFHSAMDRARSFDGGKPGLVHGPQPPPPPPPSLPSPSSSQSPTDSDSSPTSSKANATAEPDHHAHRNRPPSPHIVLLDHPGAPDRFHTSATSPAHSAVPTPALAHAHASTHAWMRQHMHLHKRKKALLIGIQYEGEDELKSSHPDVEALRELLLSPVYGYSEAGIVVMKDDLGVKRQLHPTKKNILREMHRLVRWAKDGDHFLIYYAGHGGQHEEEAKTPEIEFSELDSEKQVSTEDGIDLETIVPSDATGADSGPEHDITANVMRQILVDKLPDGCSMTAIFDSCFSGSALNLDHDCNYYYVPWIAKRPRANSRWNRVVRQNAIIPDAIPAPCKCISKLRTSFCASIRDSSSVALHRKAESSFGPNSAAENSAETPSPCNEKRFFARRANSDMVPTEMKQKLQSFAARFPCLPSGITERLPTRPSVPFTLKKPTSLAPCRRSCTRRLIEASQSFFGGLKRCASPAAFSSRCPGSLSWSASRDARRRSKACVVSVSACNDDQLTFEDPDGKQTMTEAMIDILHERPQMSYKEFMTKLSHKIYDGVRERQNIYEQGQRARKAHALQNQHSPILREESNVAVSGHSQEPRLGSKHKLNMDDIFHL